MTTTVPVPPPTVVLPSTPELRHFPDRDRYELWSGEELIGVEGYERRDDGTLVLLHTVVTEKYGRAGFARLLVASVLDELAADGDKIVPVCTYVQKFLERFPPIPIARRPGLTRAKPPGPTLRSSTVMR